MVFDWTQEEKTLLNMKQMIAAAWRMNGPQLYAYCEKLKKNQETVLPGHIGSVFLEKLVWISSNEPDAGTKIWTYFMQDADCLLNMIQKHKRLGQNAWLFALQKLEVSQKRYFKTELGRAFIQDVKEKARISMPNKAFEQRKAVSVKTSSMPGRKEDKQEQQKAVPVKTSSMPGRKENKQEQQKAVSVKTSSMPGRKEDKQELETVAVWLMEETKEQAKRAEKKRGRHAAWQIKKAAIPVLACLSASFMAVWIHGQLARNQSKWNLQQMKVSVSKEAEAFLEKNKEADSIKHTKKLPEKQKAVKEKRMEVTQQPQSPPEKLPQYREMSEKYPQLYGWLQIPDTQIDLPVMRTESDRDFYLNHDFSGAQSIEGALFVDAESCSYPQDDNTIIYGHNMKNGHMFGTLEMYSNPDYFQTHREILFDTLYETGTYEAVAVLKTRILNENEQGFRYYQFFKYENEKEFQECLDFVENNNLFETDRTLQYGDKILMLSTCEYSQENGRLVIVARK